MKDILKVLTFNKGNNQKYNKNSDANRNYILIIYVSSFCFNYVII
jgi:hypothetical protein